MFAPDSCGPLPHATKFLSESTCFSKFQILVPTQQTHDKRGGLKTIPESVDSEEPTLCRLLFLTSSDCSYSLKPREIIVSRT